MRRLFLVRHGETEGRSSVRFLGRTDTPLAEEGRDQVRRVREALAGIAFERAFVSPLRRAVESARILLDGTPLVAKSVEGFREIDFGRIEGLTEAEVAAREPEFFRLWRVEKRSNGYPEGETYDEFRTRVVAAYDRLEAEGEIRGDVLVVSHRGTIRSILTRCLGPEAWHSRKLAPDLAGWLELRDEGGWRLGSSSGLER
jgi:alpha-ribazole phosphatase